MKDSLYNFCMEFMIRKAEECDRESISELFSEMQISIDPDSTPVPYGREYLQRFFTEGENRIFIAECDDTVIGYLSAEIHHEEKKFLYIDDFCVRETYRNKGTGTALLHAAEDYAEQMHMPCILLHVLKSNEKGIRFYRRHGFEKLRDDEKRYLILKEMNEFI